MGLNIICGNPAEKPASYTRFILPFAYQLEQHPKKEGRRFYYHAHQPEDLMWRKRYMTYETADVIFNRARWFKLCGMDSDLEVKVQFKDGNSSTICITPPALVLFEWPEKPDKRKKWDRDEPDILHIGFLIVELYFKGPPEGASTPTLDNLLQINELFRYWQRPYGGHEGKVDEKTGKYEDGDYKILLREFPWRIGETKGIGSQDDPLKLYLERWAGLLEVPILDNGNLWNLFPEGWGKGARDYASGKGEGSTGWIVYDDTRTFVWTCAIMEKGGDALRYYFRRPDARASEFGHWIKLLNVDPPGKDLQDTHKSTHFEGKWAIERTYERWEERVDFTSWTRWGTFYGFNYHAGAMLSHPLENPRLWKHFGQMYFDQTLLLLYLRVVLFRFSRGLNIISAKARNKASGYGKKGREEWLDDFQGLRWQFALFTNLYQFPLLSNQQQGIEMYTLARKGLDVDELFREVQTEIHSSHDYLAIEEQQELSRSMTRLTVVATIGLILVLAMSFWGMNIIASQMVDLTGLGEWRLLGISIFISLIFLIVVVFLSGWLSKKLEWLADKGGRFCNWFKNMVRGNL